MKDPADKVTIDHSPVTWWELSTWRTEPEPIQVVRYNDKSLWVQGPRGVRRRSRNSSYYALFETRREALEFAVARANRLVESLECELADARADLRKAQERMRRG